MVKDTKITVWWSICDYNSAAYVGMEFQTDVLSISQGICSQLAFCKGNILVDFADILSIKFVVPG